MKPFQVEYHDPQGRPQRISEYIEKEGQQVLVSETIVYPDGSSRKYLYDEQGNVIDTIRCKEL